MRLAHEVDLGEPKNYQIRSDRQKRDRNAPPSDIKMGCIFPSRRLSGECRMKKQVSKMKLSSIRFQRQFALVSLIFLTRATDSVGLDIGNIQRSQGVLQCINGFNSIPCDGSWTNWQNQNLDMDLSGDIQPGDTEKIQAVIKRALGDHNVASGSAFVPRITVYLNSNGGSAVEGITLADFVRNKGIRSRIRNGEKCFSACSIVFMNGTYRGLHDESSIDRVLEPGGVLGFHAPYFDYKEFESYKGDFVNKNQTTASLVTAYLLSISNAKTFPYSLMTSMYATPPENSYLIDNIDKIGRYNIDIPLKYPEKITFEIMATACLNYYAWQAQNSALDNISDEGNFSIKWVPSKFRIEQGKFNKSIFQFEGGFFNGGLQKTEDKKVGKSNTRALITLTEYDNRTCIIDVVMDKGKITGAFGEVINFWNKVDLPKIPARNFLPAKYFYHPQLKGDSLSNFVETLR